MSTIVVGYDGSPPAREAAREVDADSIVVGSHGYGAMTALLGSVSHDLLRIADRPVTVIPPGASH